MRKNAFLVICALPSLALAGCVGLSATSETVARETIQQEPAAAPRTQDPRATSTPPAMMALLEPSFTPPAATDGYSHGEDGDQPLTITNATPVNTSGAGSSQENLPDLQNLPPSDLRLIYDPESGRKFVRFQNAILNAGPGALELIGRPSADHEIILVSQRIYKPGERLPEETLVGEFIFHPEHNHWHLNGFALYEIWSLTGEGELLSPIASGGKVSYCVTDTEYHGQGAVDDSPTPQPTYTICYDDLQGISPGWADIYYSRYPGQYVEITELADGVYALVSTVDPENKVRELLEDNNIGVTYFKLEGLRLQIVEQSEFSPTSVAPDR